MLHRARHASPPVPGAMTCGIFLNSVKVDSGMPVAALSTELGIFISEFQTVCVPARRAASGVSTTEGLFRVHTYTRWRGAFAASIVDVEQLHTWITLAEVGEELGGEAVRVVREVDDACGRRVAVRRGGPSDVRSGARQSCRTSVSRAQRQSSASHATFDQPARHASFACVA